MDEREFDDFYAASYPRVVAQIYAMIGNRDEAEECVQEAFVRAWSHRRKLERAEHPEAWVRTTAHRFLLRTGVLPGHLAGCFRDGTGTGGSG